jgi:Domain of unknown function (DUF4338)
MSGAWASLFGSITIAAFCRGTIVRHFLLSAPSRVPHNSCLLTGNKLKETQRMGTPLRKIEARLKRRLRYHLKKLGFLKQQDGRLAPPEATKAGVRQIHESQRREKLRAEKEFVHAKWPELKKYFADGKDVVPEKVTPELELIDSSTWQSDLFRLASLTWSVPVSNGYGRRLRFLVWDRSIDKLLGIIALGDPVFNLRVRDENVGWGVRDREQRLVNVLDAYVLGAVPPYNMLLGGKLVACLIRTKEVRDAFTDKYANVKGIISKKNKHASLVLVTTSSALGRSSLYNRLALNGEHFFASIGYTAGWGHFHIPDKLYSIVRDCLSLRGHEYSDGNRFGDGPNWKLRAVRQAFHYLGLSQNLLHHGIPREVFACYLAKNAKDVLTGTAAKPNYRGLQSVANVSALARARWLEPRAKRRPEFRFWNSEEIEVMVKNPSRKKTVQSGAVRRYGTG